MTKMTEEEMDELGLDELTRKKDQIYDEQISPLMRQIIEICKTNNISMHASFELTPNEGYCTTHLPLDPTPSFTMSLLGLVPRVRGNFDVLMNAVLKHAREKGHSSIYITMIERALKDV
jgi:hypothetical protein